jgi:hypothetical protein
VRGTLRVDAGDCTVLFGLIKEIEVDVSLMRLAGVDTEAVTRVCFFLGFRGFLDTVPLVASCHLSLMP